jgi:hypothetical protein
MGGSHTVFLSAPTPARQRYLTQSLYPHRHTIQSPRCTSQRKEKARPTSPPSSSHKSHDSHAHRCKIFPVTAMFSSFITTKLTYLYYENGCKHCSSTRTHVILFEQRKFARRSFYNISSRTFCSVLPSSFSTLWPSSYHTNKSHTG